MMDSVNPFVVFFHGLARLFRKVAAARGARAKLACLLRPPGWTPPRQSTGSAPGDKSG